MLERGCKIIIDAVVCCNDVEFNNFSFETKEVGLNDF